MIDEIKRMSDLFLLLRHLVDQETSRKFVILSSASRDLISQILETLAGRIAYCPLSGFHLSDIGPRALKYLWGRGELPRSFLEDAEPLPRLVLSWENNMFYPVGHRLRYPLARRGDADRIKKICS